MENSSSEAILDIHVDYDAGNTLKDTVRWTKFIAVTGIVAVVLLLICVTLAGGYIIDAVSRIMPGIEDFSAFIISGIVLGLLILGFMVFLLYRFSTLVRRGLETQDQQLFNKGLWNLRIYFTISGIFAILGLIINIFNLSKL
ncbi:MAG TPA: hypothetical protein VMI35_11565 [Puia sp.]|nr:hypothetical protein [Puia sp.]